MSQSSCRVLLIEDSSAQARIIEKILADCGCKVAHVSSAQKLNEDPGLEAFAPQAAFVDVHLRDALGLDLLDPLKRRWPSLVAVMMTTEARDDFAILAEAREKGADLVLRKPFTLGEAKALFRDVDAILETGERLRHVVVIDDSMTVCRAVGGMLAARGCRVAAFNRCEEALQRLNYDHVDVVLTDLNMPGMTGQEMIQLVRDLWPGVGVVAMSGDENADRAGADAFLRKPFESEALMQAIGDARGEAEDADLFYL